MTNFRYLEAAPSDVALRELDYNHIFGYYRTTPDGDNKLAVTHTGIGSGQANTTALVGAMKSAAYTSYTGNDTTDEYAARLCDIYEAGGYDDWFLPSKDELNQMYLNLQKNNLGGFSAEDRYWSSFEYNKYMAWMKPFFKDDQWKTARDSDHRVRPVRAF